MMIVESLLDDDIYKKNMLKGDFYKWPDLTAKWVWKNRTPDIKFTKAMIKRINDEIDHLCSLRYTEDEINYIKNIRYHSKSIGFHEFLRMFKLNRDYIHIEWEEGMDVPNIWAEGPKWAVDDFEIFVLTIVEEVYNEDKINWDVFEKNLESKIQYWRDDPFYLTEFGTRRRASRKIQEKVIENLIKKGPTGYFSGTSNMFFAKKFNITCQGTFAHQWVCTPQGIKETTLSNSQRYAWETWMDVYDGDLGICLTDTLGWDKFARDFNRKFANAFTGVRHDSGDPVEWGNKIIKLYESLGINPLHKTLMFSDSLNFEKCRTLNNLFKNKVGRVAFGVGTYLSNDCGAVAINEVMKLMMVNSLYVAKLSDNEGKTMCLDNKYLETLLWSIKN
jgi:nicotinate phosphoribosyltransferase